ncbi:hypothetical protein BGAL_0555g00060 [Botrytis galanthina]|uniref:Uncharacterized protein n=1 Tax=Botrytis galanthina TaxID=278940 RepID=A0A4S8QMX3_9HELO|nr:hypothetical protein BGAL_0555g00060 [Botrytis galanthina]
MAIHDFFLNKWSQKLSEGGLAFHTKHVSFAPVSALGSRILSYFDSLRASEDRTSKMVVGALYY